MSGFGSVQTYSEAIQVLPPKFGVNWKEAQIFLYVTSAVRKAILVKIASRMHKFVSIAARKAHLSSLPFTQ